MTSRIASRSPQPRRPAPAATAEDLRAGYGDRTVVRDLSISLAHGRVTVLVGPGGSGKTTVLRTLSGWRGDPSFWCEGRVRLRGPLVHRAQDAVDEASLRELLAPRGSGPRQEARAHRALIDAWRQVPAAASTLAPHLGTPLAAIPLPWRHLARFTATALTAGRGGILLLDEPEVDLPDEARGWVAARIRAMRGTRTVCLVTHHLGFARQVADFMVLIVGGRVIESAPAESFFRNPQHPRTRRFVRLGS